MKIKKSRLRSIIREELSRSLAESRYTGGLQVGESVWLKGEPNKGKGIVRGKYKDPQMGHIISVQWETGDSSRHIPSALTTVSTWEKGGYEYTDTSGLGDRLSAAMSSQEIDDYQLGHEDSLAGIPPQSDDEDYMLGYNEVLTDRGVPVAQPSSPGSGKPLDPDLLKGAFVTTPEERAAFAKRKN